MAITSLFLLAAIFPSYLCSMLSQTPPSVFYLPSSGANWTNNDQSFSQTNHFSDGSLARFILLQEAVHLENHEFHKNFGSGYCFYCKFSSCYLSIVFVEVVNGTVADIPPQIVWSANRDYPIRENTLLTFDHERGMELTDSHGYIVWSIGANESVSGMSINQQGNLKLFNQATETVWESFHHPTDTFLLGQMLYKETMITSRTSDMNLGSGLFYLYIVSQRLCAYVAGHSPILYLSVHPTPVNSMTTYQLTHVEFTSGNLTFFYTDSKVYSLTLEIASWISTQFLRLDIDGGLRIYGWSSETGWGAIHYFSGGWGECQFPLKCGRYGVCRNGKCTCPVAVDGSNFFEPVDNQDPSQGCRQIKHSALENTFDQYQLVDFGKLSYFSYYDEDRAIPELTNEESCTQACAGEFSCKAAFFKYGMFKSVGECYLVSDVFSIFGTPMTEYFNTSAHIKVQNPYSSNSPSSKSKIIILSIGVVSACLIILIILRLLFFKRKKRCEAEVHLEKLSETLVRFSYSEISIATESFLQKLGGGGFGMVFKGTLSDGTPVAVKRLQNDGQGTKEFLAEVETLGNIHHVNLVMLIGFCIENKHRIIVYEYMSNGSLDKWLFQRNKEPSLDWKMRKKIMLGIARGLAYIHEECTRRIAHLDVKPHNILFDEQMNAKISDFGMSKVIHRDESQVMTAMRGTLGYLAPEWQGFKITVKADIYSFGILVLEAVSGRMVLDYSQPESDIHLLKLLQKKYIGNRLIDIIDSRCEDMQHNGEEAVHMIRLGLWCLHSDYRRRPTMSSVVKVLEGSPDLEPDIPYNFSSALSPDCDVLC